MTLDEAKERLILIDKVFTTLENEDRTALDMAIQALQFDIRKWADEHFIELVEKDVWADAKKALEQVKGIHDAISEIEQMDISKVGYRMGFIEDVVDIIRKHTGVNE